MQQIGVTDLYAGSPVGIWLTSANLLKQAQVGRQLHRWDLHHVDWLYMLSGANSAGPMRTAMTFATNNLFCKQNALASCISEREMLSAASFLPNFRSALQVTLVVTQAVHTQYVLKQLKCFGCDGVGMMV